MNKPNYTYKEVEQEVHGQIVKVKVYEPARVIDCQAPIMTSDLVTQLAAVRKKIREEEEG